MIAGQNVPGLGGWEAVTALGPTASHSGFFLRAGKSAAAETPFVGTFGERITMACLATLPANLAGTPRMIELARAALPPAMAAPAWAPPAARKKICLALPERFAQRPGAAGLNPAGAEFVSELAAALPGPLSGVPIEPFPGGAGAGAQALQRALSLLGSAAADLVLFGGVDSAYDWETLENLERQDRLIDQDNLDGRLPGEAAAFAWLALPRALLTRDRPCPRVLAVGQGLEPHPILSERPCLAEGFTRALKQALSPLRRQGLRTNMWFTDITHESYRVKELTVLIARFGDVLGTDMSLHTPARELGDVGAATLPLYAVLAVEQWLRGYASDRLAVCLAGSDSGERGVIVLEVEEQWAR